MNTRQLASALRAVPGVYIALDSGPFDAVAHLDNAFIVMVGTMGGDFDTRLYHPERTPYLDYEVGPTFGSVEKLTDWMTKLAA